MVAVFGTLGFRPKSLIPTITSTPGVDKVVFYCGADKSDPSSVKAVAEARKAVVDYCRDMRIAVEPVDLHDPFDFKGIAKRIRSDVKRYRKDGKEIAVFNIAGGTRPTSSAALLACILEGIPTVYVHDITYDEIHLPLLRMEYSKILSGEERHMLRTLLRSRNKEMTEVELAKAVGKHKATVNHHVKNLVAKGVLRLEKHPKDARKKVLAVEDSIELLLGEDD
jgi:putative CRISPR-associated protein (TIGR02619 family)